MEERHSARCGERARGFHALSVGEALSLNLHVFTNPEAP